MTTQPKPLVSQRAEIAWLIEFPESGDSYRDGKRVGPAEPRKYYRGGNRRTEDHAEAVRFARKVDAEAVLTELDNDTVYKLGVKTGGFVCEHMWIGEDTRPAETLASLSSEGEALKQLEWCRTEIFSLCESVEDDPILEKALEGSDHERGYARGQMKAAKSIRNAMGEVLRIRIAQVKDTLASTPSQSDVIEKCTRVAEELRLADVKRNHWAFLPACGANFQPPSATSPPRKASTMDKVERARELRQRALHPKEPTGWKVNDSHFFHWLSENMGPENVEYLRFLWLNGEEIAALEPLAERGREAIARIINPHEFKSWQSLYDYCIRTGDSEDDARGTADWAHKRGCDEALAKADAILAALREPSNV